MGERNAIYAAKFGHAEIVSVFLLFFNEWKKKEEKKVFLKNTANVDIQSNNSDLLAHNAAVDVQNQDGWTALLYAAEANRNR